MNNKLSRQEMKADESKNTNDNTSQAPDENRRVSKILGTTILLAGLTILGYGAIAFWLIKSLPPNGGTTGRLPSLYVMGGGIVAVLIGLALRDLRLGKKPPHSATAQKKGIPAAYGVVLLVTILVIFFAVISQL
jgi:hypothetical protein